MSLLLAISIHSGREASQQQALFPSSNSHIHWSDISGQPPKVDTDLLRQLQLGAVGSLLRLQPHQVGNRSIQEMQEGGRKDGDIDMLPLEWEQQCCDSLCHCHQPLII